MTTKYQAGLRVSEYVLEECVGTGSFGEVWRARHHIWENERVAVKLPTEPEYVRYLQREGVVVHGLRHPNIVRVLGLDPYADVPYLVMELVNGPSLRRVINDHPKGVPTELAVTVLRGLLGAMITAHEHNIVHRDLKPGNVLLHLDGKPLLDLKPDDVKVSDFGLGVGDADTLRMIAQSASIDRENKVVGTLAYMASELRDGKHPPDARSDLYSIGVILFEMLTGERPVGAELPSTVRAEVPEVLDEVFRKLYARRDRRYVSAEQVLEDLEAKLRPAPPLPPTPRNHAPPPPVPAVPGPHRSCPSCGAVVVGDDQFCTQCGRQLAAVVRRCPSCNAYPGPRDQYCIFCGCKLPGVGA